MSATHRRRVGSILILLAFVLAALPAVPFWVEVAVICAGMALLVWALPRIAP